MILNKLKNIFKKEHLTISQKIENEIEYLQNELKNSVPNSLRYDSIKLYLHCAFLKLSLLKTFNPKE